MYDATIAAWESKYYYKRERPSERDHELPTELPGVTTPDSTHNERVAPEKPSGHAIWESGGYD